MASIEQVINNLPPDTATKVIRALQTPGATKDKIVEAIRNFEVSDATNLVKDFIEEKKTEFTDPANIISLAGDRAIQESGLPFTMADVEQFAGGDATGIMSQAGDAFLRSKGLPITTADIGSVVSAGREGGISDAFGVGTDIAIEAIKNFGKEEGIRRALQAGVPITTISVVANLPFFGDIARDVGSGFRQMSANLATEAGLGQFNPFFGNLLDTRILPLLNITPREREDTTIVDTPIGGFMQPNVTQGGGGTTIFTGGTEDTSDDITVTNLPPAQPSPQENFPTGGGTVVIGQPGGQPSTSPVQEANRIRNIMDARKQGANIGFNTGGLASIPRYLKGR